VIRRPCLALLVVAAAAAIAHANPRGQVKIVTPARDATPGSADTISHIIYLNRCVGGCILHAASEDDARADRTVIPPGGPGTPYSLDEFPYSQATWDAIVACMTETYAPYDVEITDVDPGPDVPHHEAVLGGTADQLGLDPTVYGGVGPLYPDCSLHDNTMSFTFAEEFPDDPTLLCAVAAQETGHAFGLEHSYNCADPMTYLDACGLQFFRNEFADCGEYAPRACMCLTSHQNTHSRLKAALGTNPVPLPAPAVTVTAPTANQSVAAGFDVRATATDRRGLSTIEGWFNGYKWIEQDVPNLGITAPAELPDGVIDVEVRVYDDLHSVYGTGTVTVTKGAPCTTADTCLDGQRCDAGRCLWDPPVGNLGDACTYPQYCLSASCEDGECSQACGVGAACPIGFECIAQSYCHSPEPEDTGGCCSVGGDAPVGLVLGQLGLAALVLGGILRRRRR
jgi:MYXO-CTERM domain-containing protein